MVPSFDDGLPAVVARDVSKTFRLPQERVHTLKERALHPRRRMRYQTFQALNRISFAVERGEFFGIAGRNGSGKSTLLKCLAGIYACEGDIWCRGRLSTFIELGVGFNPNLAADDNVVMNGIMMGLSPREARKRVDSVIEFAELEEFRDLKLKNYSSGMHDLCEQLGASSLINGNIPDRQRSDLHKVTQVVSRILPEQIEVRRYYAKFANPEHTQVTFEAV